MKVETKKLKLFLLDGGLITSKRHNRGGKRRQRQKHETRKPSQR